MSSLKSLFGAVFLLGMVLLVLQHSVHSPPEHTANAGIEKTLRAQQRTMEHKLEKLATELLELQPGPMTPMDGGAALDVIDSDKSAAVAKSAAAKLPTAAPPCPGRRPYHTVLTATGSTYQQWQSRIMYHHWKKQSLASGPCADAVGFTRLCATPDGKPDGLQNEIPSLFTVELSRAVLATHFGFGVLNRPNSVRQFIERLPSLPANKPEDLGSAEYYLILETDHVIMKPIPNLATPETPAGYIFGYMYANPSQDHIIKKYWPEGDHRGLDPVGPSPVLIHREQLKKVYKRWLDFSLDLRSNGEAEKVIQGWVQEMWGYSIAAASLGIKHRLVGDFAVEPGALSTPAQLKDFTARYYIFHYTYQFEYMLDGTPCQPWNIGEFSLDKRHFNDNFPAYPLPQPPKGANVAAFWLLNAWNEAMAAAPDWPSRQPDDGPAVQTVYGRRRLDWFSRHANGFQQELRKAPLVKELAGTKWSCDEGGGGGTAFELAASGDAQGLGKGRAGRWGTLNDPTLGDGCPVYACLFVDFGGALHNAAVSADRASLQIRPSAYSQGYSSRRAGQKWSCTKA